MNEKWKVKWPLCCQNCARRRFLTESKLVQMFSKVYLMFLSETAPFSSSFIHLLTDTSALPQKCNIYPTICSLPPSGFPTYILTMTWTIWCGCEASNILLKVNISASSYDLYRGLPIRFQFFLFLSLTLSMILLASY